jgi:HD-like signal output (HDOD) protein
MSTRRILFIEAQPGACPRIRQRPRFQRRQWDMVSADTCEAALELMSQTRVDAVVTSENAPAPEVAAFCREARRRCPPVLCFAWFDPGDKESIKRYTGSASHYLPRQCDADKLEEELQRAFLIEAWSQTEAIKKVLPLIRKSVAMPSLFGEILQKLQAQEPNLEEIALLIRNDPALCAKMLQLVNSVFFGLSYQITSAFEAVMFLGMQRVKGLILYTHIVSLYIPDRSQAFSLDRLWSHCMTTATMARWIATEESGSPKMIDEIFTAGLLHDIGKLLFAANLADTYNQAWRLANCDQMPLHEAERATFGTTHAELGACLLGIWGLPLSILEAIAWHHTPALGGNHVFSPLTAVHVANALVYEKEANGSPTPVSRIDTEYLTALGLLHRCDNWRGICGCLSKTPNLSPAEKMQLRREAKWR